MAQLGCNISEHSILAGSGCVQIGGKFLQRQIISKSKGESNQEYMIFQCLVCTVCSVSWGDISKRH